LLFGFLDYGYTLVNTNDSQVSIITVAATFIIVGGLLSLEVLLNGEIGRSIGWIRSYILHKTDIEVTGMHRSNAGTLVVSYLLGSPIQQFNLDPTIEATRQRFRYPDAPRIDLRDPAMTVLDQMGQIDLLGLKRLSTIHMAACAVKAIDGEGPMKVPDYGKILLAALAQRASNVQFSSMKIDDFPTR
jgi:hypothetical protein